MDFNLTFIESLEINIVITFYMNGLLANFRVEDGKPVFSMGSESRPMGVFFDGDVGWLASEGRITQYKVFEHGGFRIFRPISSLFTGQIDCHELVVVNSIPMVNATLFNQVVTPHPDWGVDFQTPCIV